MHFVHCGELPDDDPLAAPDGASEEEEVHEYISFTAEVAIEDPSALPGGTACEGGGRGVVPAWPPRGVCAGVRARRARAVVGARRAAETLPTPIAHAPVCARAHGMR